MSRRALLGLAFATQLTAGGLSYFADANPDALEHALETTGVATEAAPEPGASHETANSESVRRPEPGGPDRAEAPQAASPESVGAYPGILPDYATPGVEGPASGALAGILGTLATFTILSVLAWLLARPRSPQGRRPEAVRSDTASGLAPSGRSPVGRQAGGVVRSRSRSDTGDGDG